MARSPDLAAPDQTSLHLPGGAAHEIEQPRGKRVHVDQQQVVAAIHREAESAVGEECGAARVLEGEGQVSPS